MFVITKIKHLEAGRNLFALRDIYIEENKPLIVKRYLLYYYVMLKRTRDKASKYFQRKVFNFHFHVDRGNDGSIVADFRRYGG